ncbi:MAG: FAD-dependent oxidoreductase [Actinobacteria bacterium]|nr:FAD-dependent oxidoreductase [Actinomycetota bacterium]
MSVVVIGAGLAGLSAAITLQNSGREVEVIESSSRVGGRVASDTIDGFTLDHGFQLINANYPEVVRLGIINEIAFIRAPRVIDYSLGDQRFSIGDPRVAPLSALGNRTGTIGEKLAFLKYLASNSYSGKSVADELGNLGNLYTRILSPFLTGVFLTPLTGIDAVTGKNLIRSFITGAPGLPDGGVGAFTQQLSTRVKKIHLNRRIDSLQEFAGREVIVATDVTTAAQLLDISEVPKLANSTTWYHEVPADFSDSNRLLIDAGHRGPVVNSLVISNLVNSYAPAGRSLLSSTTIESASESEVRRHLSLMWGTQTQTWPLIAKYDIPKSLPIFGIGNHLVTSSRVSEKVFVAGDFRLAPSQEGALLSGRLAAQELLLNKSA